MSGRNMILIIEDDPPIVNFLSTALNSQGYRTISARTGEAGVSLAISWNPDIILLDLGLPDLDGLAVISRIRAISSTPIIIVSARHQDQEKVEALDSGADDYVSKPFSVPELLARIRVALRHSEKENQVDSTSDIYQNKDLVIDFPHRSVTIRNETIHLTPIEFEILSLMSKHAGRVLTHKQILEKIRGAAHLESDAQTLRVFVSNIRRKIERNPADPEYIQTEVGVGYRLSSPTE